MVAKRDDVAAEIVTGLAGRPDLSTFRVATPQRAVAVLEEGDEGPFDLVIADNDTHPTGGFWLAKELRGRRDIGADIPPVLLLLARPQDVWLSNWSQADAFMIKPVDPFDLAETIDALVQGRALPELPGVGGEPVDSPYEVPAGGKESDAIAHGPAGALGSGGGP